MWIVERGKLVEIAALSGHHRPRMEQSLTGVVALKAAVREARTKLVVHHEQPRRDDAVNLAASDISRYFYAHGDGGAACASATLTYAGAEAPLSYHFASSSPTSRHAPPV